MFKVTFVTRDFGSYAYEEDRHEYCFATEEDANTFYEDLENFIDERTESNSYVVCKSKPEKLDAIQLYKYDSEAKRLYHID